MIASWKTTKSYTIENGATSYSETTVPYTLTFKSDGTVSAVATGLNESGTYTVKDDVITTTMEGFETSYFRFVDGYLYFYQYYTDGGVQSEEGDILQKK